MPTNEQYDDYIKATTTNIKACSPDPLSGYRDQSAFEVELAVKFTESLINRYCCQSEAKMIISQAFVTAKLFVEEMNKRFPK